MHLLHLAVQQRAAEAPERAAIICGDSVVSYAALRDAAHRLAGGLIARGLSPGMNAGIIVGDKTTFITTVLAVFSAGAVAVLIDATEPEAQMELVRQTDVTLVVGDDLMKITSKDAPDIIFASTTDEGSSALPVVNANDLATIMFTSGTQSHRKGVMLTHRNLMASAHSINSRMSVTEEIVEYVSSPLDHAFGYARVRCILTAGGTIVLNNGSFVVTRLLSSMEKWSCNSLSAVAATMATLLNYSGDAMAKFGTKVKWVEIGSQSLSAKHRSQMRELFPNAVLIQNFGMTEAVRCTLLDFNRETDHWLSCGRPAPGVEIRICDEQRMPLPIGRQGIIETRGAHVTIGYWNDPDATAQRVSSDGWFQSDDFGLVDTEGYLHYISRRDDLINVAGEKVSPLVLEEAIRGVLTADEKFVICAISDPEGRRGEVPALCLQGDAPYPWSQLVKRILGKLPNKHLPHLGFLLAELPRTKLGKLQRAKLRRVIESGDARRWV